MTIKTRDGIIEQVTVTVPAEGTKIKISHTPYGLTIPRTGSVDVGGRFDDDSEYQKAAASVLQITEGVAEIKVLHESPAVQPTTTGHEKKGDGDVHAKHELVAILTAGGGDRIAYVCAESLGGGSWRLHAEVDPEEVHPDAKRFASREDMPASSTAVVLDTMNCPFGSDEVYQLIEATDGGATQLQLRRSLADDGGKL
jgi:hypothetical protein